MTDTQREAFEDGRWYWVRYEGLGQTYDAPALYRANAQAFYSHQFSGVPAREVIVLSALTQPQEQQAAAVLAGWKLVPIEPTKEMLDAYVAQDGRFNSARADWAAMLTSAPAAPQSDDELLAQALGALQYHTEQTRPIERTRLAIEAIDRRLHGGITGGEEPTP